MIRPAILTGRAFLNERGFGNQRFFKPWSDSDELRRFRWARISGEPFDRFGRLDPLCRIAVAAAELLSLDAPADGAPMENVGLLLGTSTGSLAVDMSFYRTVGQPGGASPMLFSYTLPSTAIGEIAIRRRIGGPNVCLNAGHESGLLALWEAVRWVEDGEADVALCVGCEAPPDAAPFAIAFLLQGADYTGPCAKAPLAKVRFCTAEQAQFDASSRDAGRLDALAESIGPDAASVVYLPRPSVLRDSDRSFALAVERSRDVGPGVG